MKAITLLVAIGIIISSLGTALFAQPGSDIELVGRHEFDFTTRGRSGIYRNGYFYMIASGQKILTYDLRDPENVRLASIYSPKIQGRLQTAGLSELLLVNENLVCLFNYNPSGFLFLSLDNPAHPDSMDIHILDEDNFESYYYATSTDSLIFLPDFTTLRIEVVRENFQVAELASIEMPGIIEHISINDTILAVSCVDWHGNDAIDQGLQLVDISDPTQPELTTWIQSWGEYNGGGIYASVLGKDYVVFHENYDERWHVEVSNINFVDIQPGHRLQNRLTVPTSIYDPKIFKNGDNVWLQNIDGFDVYDVSDIADPRLVDSIQLPTEIHDEFDGPYFHVYNTLYAYVEDRIIVGHGFDAWDPLHLGFSIHDISDPDTSIMLSWYSRASYSVQEMIVRENLAFLRFENNVSVMDISDPGSPIERNNLLIPQPIGFGVNQSGDLLIAKRDGIYAYDVSDPDDIELIGKGGNDSLAEFGLIAFGGDYAYQVNRISGQRFQRLWVYDISLADSIYEIGTIEILYNPTNSIEIAGNYLYLAGDGLLTIDIHDPANPEQIYLNEQLSFPHITVDSFDDHLFMIERNEWLLDFDVATPDLPVKINGRGVQSRTPGQQTGSLFDATLSEDGGMIALADGVAGLRILNNNWLTRPIETGSYDTEGEAVRVEFGQGVNGSQMVLVAENDALLLFDASQALSVSPTTLSPYTFSLSSPFPNPFNSSTTISFSAGGQASLPVHLAIYDLSGRLVADLLDPHSKLQTPNSKLHSVVWNATDLPNGLYLIKLSSNNQNLYARALLLR